MRRLRHATSAARHEVSHRHRVDVTGRTLLLVAGIVATCWVLIQLTNVLLVVIAAAMFAGTLAPALESLERRGVKRGIGIAVVFGIPVLVIGLFLALTLPALFDQLRTVVEALPATQRSLVATLSRSQTTAPLAESIRDLRITAITPSFGAAFDLSRRAVTIIVYFLSTVFLALYLLIDRDRVRGAMFALVPRAYHIRASRILLQLERIVGGFIRGQLLISALMGVFVFTLLTICGVPNALALAVFAAVADVLPYIGVLLALGPATVAAMSQGPVTAGIVVVSMLAYAELEARLLIPKIYGSALRLPSSAVLVALLVGGALMGIPGAILALPVAAAIRMIVEELHVALPGDGRGNTTIRALDEAAELEYRRRTEGEPATRAAGIAVAMAAEHQGEDLASSGRRRG